MRKSTYIATEAIDPSSPKGIGLLQLNNYRIKWDKEAANGRRARRIPKRLISVFGMRSSDGVNHIIGWIVTGDRKHGYTGKTEPMSRYNKDLFNDMFKGWK